MCRAHYICLIFVTLTDHRNWYPCDGLPKKQRSFHLKTAERKEKNEYLVLYNVLAERVDLGIIHCTKDTKKNDWLLDIVVHRFIFIVLFLSLLFAQAFSRYCLYCLLLLYCPLLSLVFLFIVLFYHFLFIFCCSYNCFFCCSLLVRYTGLHDNTSFRLECFYP